MTEPTDQTDVPDVRVSAGLGSARRSATVEVQGLDVSNIVSAVSFATGGTTSRAYPCVVLTIVPQTFEVNGKADVRFDVTLTELLRRLGWATPEEVKALCNTIAQLVAEQAAGTPRSLSRSGQLNTTEPT